MNRIVKRMAVPVGAAIILGSSGFAFMASNTFANMPGAGAGTQTISGYSVGNLSFSGCDAEQNVCYLHGTVTPRDLRAPDAGTLSIKFDNSGWIKCELNSNYSNRVRPFTCDLRPGQYPGDLNTLTVSAFG